MPSPNNRLLIRLTSGVHRCWYRLTGGLIGGRLGRAHFLLLTTAGRKTGRRHTTPLLYVEDGDDLVLVASNAGDDRDPNWWLNLKKSPQAEAQVGASLRSVVAERASAGDRARLWPQITRMFPDYEAYQSRTRREIPLVILRRPRRE